MPNFTSRQLTLLASFGAGLLVSLLALSASVRAQSVPITAVVLGPPPTTQAVILQPVNDQVFSTTPLVVSGTCGPGLLVRVFNNSQLAGSITCSVDGDFIVNITLQVGQNVLSALNYDAQEQPGPDSPDVTVTVTLPSPGTPVLPSGVIDEEGVVSTEETQEEALTTLETVEGLPPDQVYLFENTFIEPLAKGLGVHPAVAPQTNQTVSAIVNVVFVATVTVPILAFSCIKLGWLGSLLGPKL